MKKDILQDIIAEVALRTDDNRMRINCNFDRELPIFGNANLLTSIFRNLTENAIAYSGGRDIFQPDERNSGGICLFFRR